MIKTFPLPAEENETSTVDVVFSFDTTGSMSSVLKGLRKNLEATIKKLFTDVPDIRIGLIAHGDYCDMPNFFWSLQPTKNQEAIIAFIKNAPGTGGGDMPECYELVIHEAIKMDWKAATRVLVVIGDANPHEQGYQYEDQLVHIDWQKEAELAKEKGITIFSCHALASHRAESLNFYNTIARITGGYYFTLENLASFKDYMTAICLHAADGAETQSVLEGYREELEQRIAAAHSAVEQESLRTEAEEVHSALEEVHSQGVFSPSATSTRERILAARGTPSRLATFRTQTAVSDASMSALFSTLSGGSESAAPAPSEPTYFGGHSREEDDSLRSPIFATPARRPRLEPSFIKPLTPLFVRTPARRRVDFVDDEDEAPRRLPRGFVERQPQSPLTQMELQMRNFFE